MVLRSVCYQLRMHGRVGLSLSLTLLYTHSHTHTHTHTHMHTDTYISLSPTCLSFQSAFVLLCSATCSQSSNQSLYLQRLRSRLSAGLLYYMHSMCSLTYLRVEFSYLVPPGDAEGFCFLLGVLLLPPVSPVPRGLLRLKFLGSYRPQVCFVIFQFCVYARQTALFCSFIKDCVNYPFAFGSLHSRS